MPVAITSSSAGGTPATEAATDGGASFRCAYILASSDGRGNGTWPVSVW